MGQNSNEQKSRLKIFSISVSFNSLLVKNRSSDFEEFKKLAKNNSNFFNSNLNTYSSYSNLLFAVSQINVIVGFSPYNSKSESYYNKRELKLGIGYNSGVRRSFNFFRNIEIPGDTFTSSNNNIIYLDTLIYSNYDYFEVIDELEIGITYLYKTDPEKRISLHTGYGIGLGFSIYSGLNSSNYDDTSLVFTTIIDGTEYSSYKAYDNNYYSSDNRDRNVKTKNSVFIRTYIPFGLNIRLSKKHDILNQMNLFFQTKFGFEYQQIIDDNNYLRPFYGFGIGLKYDF